MNETEQTKSNLPSVEGLSKIFNISILDLIRRHTLMEEIRRVLSGLKMPRDSGEYIYAKQQITRVWAPVIGVFLPALLILFLVLFGTQTAKVSDPPIGITIIKPEEVKIVDIKPLKPEEVKPLEPQKVDDALAVCPDKPFEGSGGDGEAGYVQGPGSGSGSPDPFSPKPAEFDSVWYVKSPIVFSGVYSNRNPGAIGSLAGGGGGGGGSPTESAVLRALRWLKKEQQSDGSWLTTKPAMTGMALLTYLAHGETPASEEFGPTVERAIRWLIENQTSDGRFKESDPHEYSLPIAAYALAEAYGMTRVPMLKYAAEKAMNIIIKGQNGAGMWDYNCQAGSARNDTSYAGWCIQAVKAGYLANLDCPGISNCMRRAVHGLKVNYSPSGSFGYTSPGESGLTGVGVLCLQLLGASRDAETRHGLEWLERATYDWNEPWLANPIYYWYYVTQAKFHASPETWKKWNKLFSPVLVKNQKIDKGAIAGPKGKMVDVGWWEPPNGVKGHTDGVVQDTCLCALQLEVYYRYLPTFKPPEESKEGMDVAATAAVEVKITQ